MKEDLVASTSDCRFISENNASSYFYFNLNLSSFSISNFEIISVLIFILFNIFLILDFSVLRPKFIVVILP